MPSTNDTYVPTYPAFKVRYLGPTDHRGARYKVSCHGYSDTITEPYDYALGGGAKQAKQLALVLREKVAPDALPPTVALVGSLSDSEYVVTFGTES